MKKIELEIRVEKQSINLDIRADEVCYVRMGEYIYSLDNSTGEQIVSKWHVNDGSKSHYAIWEEE